MRKGLLAPQNTFLDTIAERFDGSRKFLDLGSGLNLGWRPQLGIGVSFVKIFDEKFIVKNVFLDLFRINYSLRRENFLNILGCSLKDFLTCKFFMISQFYDISFFGSYLSILVVNYSRPRRKMRSFRSDLTVFNFEKVILRLIICQLISISFQ